VALRGHSAKDSDWIGPEHQCRTPLGTAAAPTRTDISATVASSFPRLTTKLTTKPRDLSGLTRTDSHETPRLTCENGRTQTASDRLHGIGNRVTCKGPWVQIPPPPTTSSARCHNHNVLPVQRQSQCPFVRPRRTAHETTLRLDAQSGWRILNPWSVARGNKLLRSSRKG